MNLIARILNLKNRYQWLREFECTLIELSDEKMKLSGKTYIIITIRRSVLSVGHYISASRCWNSLGGGGGGGGVSLTI